MHAYLLLAGVPPLIAERRARAALTRVAEVLPSIGAEPQVHTGTLSALPGAWAMLCPSHDYDPPLLQTASNSRHLCLCFGKVSGQERTAKELLEAFESGGSEPARSLDGSYAAIIVADARRQLSAFTDLIGMRAPRFITRGQELAIASHDLALVAAGAADGELDLDSVAATVACDWSLGGRPLLRNVATISAHEVLVWQQAKLELQRAPLLDTSKRLSKADKQATRKLVSDIADTMELGARQFAEHKPLLRCSLTAGKDSRMVLALLLQTGRRPVSAQTAGTATSADSVVARKLARFAGITHETVPVSAPDASSFEAMSRLLSFSMNGMTNAKRALAELPRWNPEQRILAGGVGGGIFAGAFYHYFQLERAMPQTAAGVADVLLRRRFRRITELPFTDPACARRLVQRLEACVEPLFELSSHPYDVVDLFYLYERYAQWAALGEKNSWARRWTPFENTTAIKLAYQLPAPIGNYAVLQPLLVRRHLPLSAYWTPINREALLALQGGGLAHEVAQRGVRRLLSGYFRWREPAERAGPGFEEVRANTLNGPLKEMVVDLLTQPSGVAVTLLGRQGIQRLLTQHQRAASELQSLGFLITAEVFRQQLAECVPSSTS